jgi:hypothetical protein
MLDFASAVFTNADSVRIPDRNFVKVTVVPLNISCFITAQFKSLWMIISRDLALSLSFSLRCDLPGQYLWMRRTLSSVSLHRTFPDGTPRILPPHDYHPQETPPREAGTDDGARGGCARRSDAASRIALSQDDEYARSHHRI